MNQLMNLNPYSFIPEASRNAFEKMVQDWYEYSCADDGVVPSLWHGMAFKEETAQSFILEFINELGAYTYYKEQDLVNFNKYQFPVPAEDFVVYHMDAEINEHFIHNVDVLEANTLHDMHIYFMRNQMCFGSTTDRQRIYNLPIGGAW